MRRCYRHPDRETAVSCSECGRPICPDCMVFAPVGIRCPDHSGRGTGVERAVRTARRAGSEGVGAIVTRLLIATNVLVYFAELAQGAGVNANSGSIYYGGVLIGPSFNTPDGIATGVADGGWWRLITAAFLHYGPLHLAINMYSLYICGTILEPIIGRGRFLLLYLVAGLAGSAGALLANPLAATVGASGAIFGLFGALLVLEYQRTGSLAGQMMTLIVINLVLSFTLSGISWGGHVGGLVGGILGTLALSRFGRGHAAYGRLGLLGIASLVVIGAVSVAIAYWKVRGYAV